LLKAAAGLRIEWVIRLLSITTRKLRSDFVAGYFQIKVGSAGKTLAGERLASNTGESASVLALASPESLGSP